MSTVKRPHPLATCTSAADADVTKTAPQVLAKRKRTTKQAARNNDTQPVSSSQGALPNTTASEPEIEDDNDNDTASILSTSSSDPSSLSSSDAESDLDTDINADTTTTTTESRAEARKSKSALREQLRAFLPQLRAANEALDPTAGSAFEIVDADTEKAGGNSAQEGQDGAAEEEPYIEMELGLGVLEEKQAGAGSESENDDDGSEDGGESQDDVLGKLMGKKRRGEGVKDGARKVVIQEL